MQRPLGRDRGPDQVIRIPHLETDVTTACQLSCVACNHHVPLWRKAGPKHADPRQVELDLNHLSKILHAEVWGALGGEPLLSPKLVEILHIAKDSGISDEIEVWTNGLLLPTIADAFWKAPFDTIVLSIYPGKHTEKSLETIAAKCETWGKRLSLRDEVANPNFRTLLEAKPTGPEETARKFASCFFRQFSRVANWGFFYTCCCAPHMSTLVQGRTENPDGIRIYDLEERHLRAYLLRSEPLVACSTCAGRDTAIPITWSEERDPQSWLRASAGGRE